MGKGKEITIPLRNLMVDHHKMRKAVIKSRKLLNFQKVR